MMSPAEALWPAPVLKVLETCLYAADLSSTAEFYERVLGLVPLSSEEGRHVFFRVGDGMFLLFDPRRTELPSAGVPPHGARGAGHVAFAVGADSLPDWRRRLTDHGVEIESEVTWPNGGTSLYVRDPAGNSVELTSPTIWGISEEVSFGRPSREG